MAEFDSLRQELDDARSGQAAAHLSFLAAGEQLKRIAAEKENLLRSYNPNDQTQQAKLHALESQEKTLKNAVGQLQEEVNSSKAKAADLYKKFSVFTDPRQQISRLNDAYPFLLMPVRIETRFKKVMGERQVLKDQLWIRIFPDDFMIDSFEEMLSEAEVKNAAYYWAKYWEAGGLESMERAAWRVMVDGYGSGRAGYILDNYKPADLTGRPERLSVNEIILVITTAQLPGDIAQDALKAYWTRSWVGYADLAEQQGAFEDLVDVVGPEKANEYITTYKPVNITVLPPEDLERGDVVVKVEFLQLQNTAAVNTKQQSWSQAPKVFVMPDRFVVTGYQGNNVGFEVLGEPIPSPLIVGPDPSAKPEKQFIRHDNGDLTLHDDIRWMSDFEAAIKIGLGFKIDITAEQVAQGFSRISALGIRMSGSAAKGQELLETLLEHHRISKKGCIILPQGTPTNNTEEEGTSHQYIDDPDESYDNRKKDHLFDLTANILEKRDGQWLAEALGINPAALQKVLNSDHTDQKEARLMNTALWPATLGYMMETMMHGVFTNEDIAATRTFFNRYISGRNTVPAIKVGKQPYGILPVTNFSKIGWFKPHTPVPGITVDTTGIPTTAINTGNNYLQRLYELLKKVDADFLKLLPAVSFVGKTKADPHRVLLDVLGQNAGTVEFYQRQGQSKEDFMNRFKLEGIFSEIIAALLAGAYIETGKALLKQLGYTGDVTPDILNKFFWEQANKLKGPVVDDQPLSETMAIRKYVTGADNKNYIHWLIQAAQTSHDALRKQQGFLDDKIPVSLLYLVLHHALDLSYVEVSRFLYLREALITPEHAKVLQQEPPFINIQQKAPVSESKYLFLYQPAEKITGSPHRLLGDHIPKLIKMDVATEYLGDQLDALEWLKDVPTARLERLFTEHIDCCSYRLDAWKNGLVNYQLTKVRGQQQAAKGIYLGAYGYLENVRSENKVLTPFVPEGKELQDIFIKEDPTPIVKDNTNGGFILAPSVNHAVTASILRNGYISNGNPDAFRINLSSERVRKALSVIEGIRGGQSLGALLGYYLERGLHESHPGVELDYYIYQLRKAFPLVANKDKDTKVDESSDIPIDAVEAIEARNVIDGLALITHIKKTGHSSYPFGKAWLPDFTTPNQGIAVAAEVKNILDINDAIADVAMAESVHQVVQGNYERGAASFDTYAKGNFPPIPDVIQTPRSGINLTHRVGLHLEAGLDGTLEATPRAQAEPAVNKWLKSILPPTDKIICLVSYNGVTDKKITAANLGLQPIDILYTVNLDSEQQMKELDDRITFLVMQQPGIRPDTVVEINYIKGISGHFTFFELAPLLNSVATLLLKSRALTATDILLPAATSPVEPGKQQLNPQRIHTWRNALQSLVDNQLKAYLTHMDTLLSDMVANRSQQLSEVDQLMNGYAAILNIAGAAGLPQTGIGFIYETKRSLFTSLLTKINELVTRWTKKAADFEQLMTDYDALPLSTSTEEKFNLLEQARVLVSTVALTLPPDPDTYKTQLIPVKLSFTDKLKVFQDLLSINTDKVFDLLQQTNAALPVIAYDTEAFEVASVETAVINAVEDLAVKALALSTDLKKRLLKSGDLLTASAALPDSKKKVDLLLEAAKQLFQEDFKLVPEFTPGHTSAQEWANSHAAQAQLLLHSQASTDFPVDDWLYGIARVREHMHHWENTVLLTEALVNKELTLHPVQFPYKNADHWLAVPYPETYEIESERLLYTAHYATAFDASKPQCGLLLDEWTELIPAKKETAGIAFHYDKPNAEPPQVMLLAMPPVYTGAWNWSDLQEIVHETFQAAKARAIEPEQIDTTNYARFLPAVVSSMSVHPISISLNYGFNNSIHEILQKP
ncbi:hypothetical protein SAMN05444266_109222 [Chitinophaga jiangningensis]|uniref:Uncharacterized protein n=1 Tax=Chitinophaga jiangningensis TaxID=1419482 RepID=A0A1M7KA37_9BACT|nr:hypothetical protein [Chitinophaga jiangningensis]SHM62140.1 hypothetical protein SAMN05444266_109222 [Chitinophaga jiangningensis]